MAVRGHLGHRHRRGQSRAPHAAQRPLAGPQHRHGHPHRGRLLGVRLGVHHPAHPPTTAAPAPAGDQPSRPQAEFRGSLAVRAVWPSVRGRRRPPVRAALVLPTAHGGVGQSWRPTASAITAPEATLGPRHGCRHRHHRRPTCWCRHEPKCCSRGRSRRCARPKLEGLKAISGAFTAPPELACPAASCAAVAGHQPPDNAPLYCCSSRATSRTACTTGHGCSQHTTNHRPSSQTPPPPDPRDRNP